MLVVVGDLMSFACLAFQFSLLPPSSTPAAEKSRLASRSGTGYYLGCCGSI